MLKLTADFNSGAPEGMLARLVIRRTDRLAAPFALNSPVKDRKAHFEGELEPEAEYVYTLASYFEGAAVNFEEHGKICTAGEGNKTLARIESGQCIEISCKIV